jgi:hypothetical protein
MNKTIYLPDDEAETWDKARRLANDRLSPVILKALKEYIMTKEAEAAEAAGFERIEVEFDDSEDNNLPKRKAFRGRWIIPPGSPSRAIVNDIMSRASAVAVTAKGNVVVCLWKIFEDETGAFPNIDSWFSRRLKRQRKTMRSTTLFGRPCESVGFQSRSSTSKGK